MVCLGSTVARCCILVGFNALKQLGTASCILVKIREQIRRFELLKNELKQRGALRRHANLLAVSRERGVTHTYATQQQGVERCKRTGTLATAGSSTTARAVAVSVVVVPSMLARSARR